MDSQLQTPAVRLKRLKTSGDRAGHYITFKQTSLNDSTTQARCAQSSRSRNAKHKTPGSSVHRASCPAAGLLCPVTKLCVRYGSVFGFDALDLNPLGRWITYAWHHAGEDTFLDLASDYAYASMAAFQHRNAENTIRTSVAGKRALRSLRTAVEAFETTQKGDNLVVAVMLHYAAEVGLLTLQSDKAEADTTGISTLWKLRRFTTYHTSRAQCGCSEALLAICRTMRSNRISSCLSAKTR